MTTAVATPQHDEITGMLAKQVEEAIAKIVAGNEVLLAADSGTGDREIDKAFKDGKVEDKEAVKAWERAEKAREAYRKSLLDARNLYRTNVLKQDAVDEDSEVDKDSLKEIRKVAMESLSLMITYATANQKKDVVAWAQSISVPQVGRQGSSTAGGTKKPRAYVKFDGKTFDSFGEAAKGLSVALSEGDNKVTVNSGDLVNAWSEANEAESFEFGGKTITVTLKNADKAAA